MSNLPDRRINAYRPDLAEEALRDQIQAPRYTAGAPAQVIRPLVPLRPRPDLSAGIDTQLLRGETVRVLDTDDTWCWIKSDEDGYVGYLPEDALRLGEFANTHTVSALRTFVYEQADLKSPAMAALSMGSHLLVTGEAETRGTRYFLLANGHAVIANHCTTIGSFQETDYVSVAGRFVETPYLWGGRSAFGIDCSGLVQLSMMMTGRKAPRDSDMQAGLGAQIERHNLRRGDLVFWKGHVAIMEDEETIVHANGHSMTVARESLEGAIERTRWLYSEPTGYRRP
ncbi:C40 family peptidase [Pararhizobium sp.]|uniref:C40 family peptidase n=1 Tax=Pararhizobium sp. TaxID=1977563 RepID=UPI0027287FEA|nr:NlpC/P60 family protein [Pararhizobium sp.]MDO9417866.1 NlpC/P60 family protein [Pararhizobium sp.]